MAKYPETRLKERIQKKLTRIKRVYAIKIQQVAVRGTPDMQICVNGWSVFMELKRSSKEDPEPLQKLNLWAHAQAGGISLVVHPDNEKEAIDFIKELSVSDKILEVPQCLRLPKKV